MNAREGWKKEEVALSLHLVPLAMRRGQKWSQLLTDLLRLKHPDDLVQRSQGCYWEMRLLLCAIEYADQESRRKKG